MLRTLALAAALLLCASPAGSGAARQGGGPWSFAEDVVWTTGPLTAYDGQTDYDGPSGAHKGFPHSPEDYETEWPLVQHTTPPGPWRASRDGQHHRLVLRAELSERAATVGPDGQSSGGHWAPWEWSEWWTHQARIQGVTVTYLRPQGAVVHALPATGWLVDGGEASLLVPLPPAGTTAVRVRAVPVIRWGGGVENLTDEGPRRARLTWDFRLALGHG